jgi:hypothetical protein
MYRSIKFLGLALVMLLSLYPIAELTRVILVSGNYYFPEMEGQFAAEITIMWVLYLSIVPVFLIINDHRLRHYRLMKRRILKQTKIKMKHSLLSDENNNYIRVDYISRT